MSFLESDDIQDNDEDSESEEIVSSSLVEPYQDEPRAHSCDEETDDELDKDGLSPAIMRADLKTKFSSMNGRIIFFKYTTVHTTCTVN